MRRRYLRFVQVPERGPPNGGTSESPHAKRAEKMKPGAAELREPEPLGSASLEQATAATTRYGVSPDDDPSPSERIEGFFQLPIWSSNHVATPDTPRVGVRSDCPSNRAKQSRNTKLNISSTGVGHPPRAASTKNHSERSNFVSIAAQYWANPPLPSIAVFAQRAAPYEHTARTYVEDSSYRNTICYFCNPDRFCRQFQVAIPPTKIQPTDLHRMNTEKGKRGRRTPTGPIQACVW